MASPLSGALAKTIGKALAPIFLPATLTRGSTVYRCRAMFEEFGMYPALGSKVSSLSDVTILVTAASLSTRPAGGDVIQISKTTFASDLTYVVISDKTSQDAVKTDPAGAVWELRCKALPIADTSSSGASTSIPVSIIGISHDIYRVAAGTSNPLDPSHKVGTTKALFADGRTSGYNFNKPTSYGDTLQSVLVETGVSLQIGDFLVGPHTYFVVAMEPLRPISAIECNAVITLSRSKAEAGAGAMGAQPSQSGGSLKYFGRQYGAADNDIVASGVPACMIANAGRATGQVETPSGAPGPSRWQIYLPPSVFPKGTVRDRDYVTDDEGNRHMGSVAAWTNMGYRVEAVREQL